MNTSYNTILITGGGSGIGLQLAKQFIGLNNKVIIAGRTIDKLKAAKEANPKLDYIQFDINKEEDVDRLVEKVEKDYPKLNFLINNAGMMRMYDVQKADQLNGENKQEILTNFYGPVQLSQRLLPHLLKQNSSALMNVSSGLAYMPFSTSPVYSATKAALHSYTMSLREQLKDTKLKVFELLPPLVETEMSKGVEMSMPTMSSEKLARTTIKAVNKDKLEIRPGMTNMMYRMSKLAPGMIRSMMAKDARKILENL